MVEERIQDYIQGIIPGIEVIVLKEDTSTSELAARALGLEVGQIAKSILYKGKDDYLMVVAAGDVRLDSKLVKQLAGSRVRMANAEEVMAVTGYSPGGVCPFALPNPLTVYADASLRRFDVVYAAAGSPHSAVPVTFDQLVTITGARPCDVALPLDE
ncbi:MAG: YbaK/EbsC family protein [Methylocystaceae bacterium]